MATGIAAEVETLESILIERLAESTLLAGVADIVLAALAGPDELRAVIDDGNGPTRHDRSTTEAPVGSSTASVYLSSVGVEGFRGIGQPATLKLAPGPGLTLVTGRNGSGKSSFAEAVELALTGENKRWAPPRSAVWRDGWRNLHHHAATRIVLELAVDGQAGTTKVIREWADGDSLGGGEAFALMKGKARRPLQAMGWGRALEWYRPFLSYAELGALVDGRPSEMYDALARILGLDELASAEKLLAESRKSLDAVVKASASELVALRRLLDGRAEPQAERLRVELGRRDPDLAALKSLSAVEITIEDGGTRVDGARSVLAVPMPDPTLAKAAVTRLAQAQTAVSALTGGSAQDARRLTQLLAAALEHQSVHPGEACPVCAGRALDDEWASATRDQIARLRQVAAAAEAAHQEQVSARTDLRQLHGPIPSALTAEGEGFDLTPSAEAWQRWVTLVNGDDVERLVTEAPAVHLRLREELAAVKIQARALVAERLAAWQPIDDALTSWLELARRASPAAGSLSRVKAAIAWLKATGQDVRSARLAPFAGASAKVWGQLRQESNVELGPIQLSGVSTAPNRKVALDVTIDGVPGAALAVMSQGELHALGLALFLPRAAAEASPFRFLVIDDPVQSMDPAKVDGLARVLAETARNRQVVVFSHDDRLAEAVRRLQLPAAIWEVTRREGSTVELMKNDDPIGRYLSDARAIAKTDQLTVDARALVVIGMCRGALEAACHQRTRSRRLATGIRHTEIERAIDQARTLHQAMALALFDDASRGGDVVPKLSTAFGGPSAVQAFRAVKTGVHEPYQGDLMTLIRAVEALAGQVREVKT